MSDEQRSTPHIYKVHIFRLPGETCCNESAHKVPHHFHSKPYLLCPFVSFLLLQEYYTTLLPPNFHFYHVFLNGVALPKLTGWRPQGSRCNVKFERSVAAGEGHELEWIIKHCHGHEERAQSIGRWLTDDSSFKRWQHLVQFAEFTNGCF